MDGNPLGVEAIGPPVICHGAYFTAAPPGVEHGVRAPDFMAAELLDAMGVHVEDEPDE